MSSVVSLNPFRCRMWKMHDRLQKHVNEQTCKAEIDSYSKHGQLVPVLGRRLRGDPAYDVELIYGARRLFVARHVNKPLQVELRDFSDRDAIVAMDVENRQRLDISAYERGLSYSRWLRGGYFGSQDEIAHALKISAAQVSRLVKLAQLPPLIVEAFATPLDIREGWALEIFDAVANPRRRKATVATARAISALSPRPPAREVYQQIVTASLRGRKSQRRTSSEIVTGDDGEALFRIKYHGKRIALLLPGDKLSSKSLADIRDSIVRILQRPKTPTVDASRLKLQPQPPAQA